MAKSPASVRGRGNVGAGMHGFGRSEPSAAQSLLQGPRDHLSGASTPGPRDHLFGAATPGPRGRLSGAATPGPRDHLSRTPRGQPDGRNTILELFEFLDSQDSEGKGDLAEFYESVVNSLKTQGVRSMTALSHSEPGDAGVS